MEIKNQFEKIKKESEEIKTEAKQRIVGYIVAAFGLVAGLAWNEAIKSLIEYIFPLSRNTLLLKFIYAILMTLVLVFISIYLVKLLKAEEK
jgi:C4-dicarboxylate transporter